MKHFFWVLFLFASIISLSSCKKQHVEKQVESLDKPVEMDLDAIKQRGFLRAVVDNTSTSYYIYRGRRMGYEYEMLRSLAKELGVKLKVTIADDMETPFQMLREGSADIIAINLERTPEREGKAFFTRSTKTLRSLLVQRKDHPEKLQSLSDLHGKRVHVREGAVYKHQLLHWKDSLGIDFEIVESPYDSEGLVNLVADGEVDFTVVDEDIATVNANYYPHLDISLAVSQPTKVGWAVRPNAPQLLAGINSWMGDFKKTAQHRILYDKYFLNKTNSYFRSNSPFSSLAGNRISSYDEIIKKAAENLGWDWRLLAALIFKESRFDTEAVSYAGASGLLQLMPVTLERFGVSDPNDPYESLMGGVNYLKYLDKFWMERIPETNERIKYILASYNVGHGHVQDAWRLALAAGSNPSEWENVAHYLQQKSNPEVYRDPLVKSGYAKGHVAVNYVDDIVGLYESYKILVEP